MRRFVTIAAAGILLLLAGCAGTNRSGTATPGNLELREPQGARIGMGIELTEVSSSYLKRLCTYAWLDTDSMTYVKLEEDGSFSFFEDEALSEKSDCSGTWNLYRDEHDSLLLRLSPQGEEPLNMEELELYDQSIYAYGPEDQVYLWLMCDGTGE